LIINVVSLLDQVFEKCPKTQFSFYCYRFEGHKWTDEISNLQKGDIYHNIGINSTTINPYIYNFPTEDKDKVMIRFIFYIPKNTKGYYINNPFFSEPFSQIKYSNKEIIGFNEYEFVLPRGNYWYIHKRIKVDNNLLVYVMQLINQPKPENLNVNKHQPNKIIISKKEYITKYGSFDIIQLPKIENVIDIYKNNQNIVKYWNAHKTKLNEEKEKIRNDFYYHYFENKLNKKSIKLFVKTLTEKIPKFLYTFTETTFNKKYKLNIILNINNKELYKFFYKNISQKEIIINIPFLCFIKTKNQKKMINNDNIRELFSTSSSAHIYKSIKNNDIKNHKSLSNNLFVKCDYPMFYNIELNIQNTIQLIDLYPEYTLNNIKKFLYIGNPLKLTIKNIIKNVYGFDNTYKGYNIYGSVK
jgi:hypothetical protein